MTGRAIWNSLNRVRAQVLWIKDNLFRWGGFLDGSNPDYTYYEFQRVAHLTRRSSQQEEKRPSITVAAPLKVSNRKDAYITLLGIKNTYGGS